jgi:predicted nucleic-acid-binding protein
MRGYYKFSQDAVRSVIQHLLDQPQITLEDRDVIVQALANQNVGLDFADAVHHASYKHCARVASFDDRSFARRAKKLGLAPAVMLAS